MSIRKRFDFPTRAAAAVAACALPLAIAGAARADDCDSLAKPVYVAGSTAAKPFIASVATALANLSDPISVVYQGQGSCTGVNYLASATTGTITGTGAIWGKDGAEGTCTLAAAGQTVDIGISDVFAESCGVSSLPKDVKDFQGPVQTMTFVVPGGSSGASNETIISAEAAYLVFGFGGDADTAWTDNTLLFRRNESSGTQQMISAAIKVPAAKWKGVDANGSGGVITMLGGAQSAGNQDKALGILATDGADKNRSTLKILGYQHYDQSCAYWPDSDDQSFDKANVRDGHYAIWGPLHMLAKTESGTVSNEGAKLIIDYLSGAKPATDFDLIKVEARGGVVPSCAMQVKRTSEVGPLMSYQPDQSCTCKFLTEATGEMPSDCQKCDTKDDCSKSKPACNFGFCEVK